METLYTVLDWLSTPLSQLAAVLKAHSEYRGVVYGGGLAAALALLVAIVVFRKYFSFIFKSVLRNLLRTSLAGMAVMVLVFVVTLICSILVLLGNAMKERSKDMKAVVTERWQIPSQMPFSYASTLEQGAARSDHPEDAKPQDSMTWQFFGGTTDPAKRTRENSAFMFAMDPHKIRTMMDDLDQVDPQLIEAMVKNKKGVLMGRTQMEMFNKRVGERFTLTSFNYKDLQLEFEIVGQLPVGRYDQSCIMNRQYLNDALFEAYPREHNGAKHPMADKTLNLVWLQVPDPEAFRKVADQVMTSSYYTVPSVKCETASSGISTFLDAYADLIWAAKWFLVPAILGVMALVIANAISISVRERRTEMAVLKVLGFGPSRIMALVLGEALLVGAGFGLLSAAITYGYVHVYKGGFSFPIAFFGIFDIPADALWWGFVFGGVTSLLGSILPAWSARTVKVSEVFAKVG
jgi:putative ABC transport system permease protein